MILNRRTLLASSAALVTTQLSSPLAFAAGPISALGRDATGFGVRPNADGDQTRALQRAIDETSKLRVPLALPPGVYRTGLLNLSDGAQITGVRGASRLVFAGGASLLASEGADLIDISNLVLDGAHIPLPQRRGLVHCIASNQLHIAGCTITASGSNGIWHELSAGEINGNTITDIADTAVAVFDARGLRIAANVVRGASQNGIQIIRNAIGDDGTLIEGNRVEDIKAGPGGSGQYGNAINAFRAGNVIIRGNRIKNCDFSAVRGNSASNIQISGNTVSDVREVALYSEFSFEGAVIANNVVDGAALGVSVANFNEGGRLAVVQGNVIRNLLPKRPAGTSPDDPAGVGIYVEADTTVNANVIENAPSVGIMAGWGRYLRDVVITGNVVRNTAIGIGVSVTAGAGKALVSDNMISGATRGAVVGLDHARPATADLLANGSVALDNIKLGENQSH